MSCSRHDNSEADRASTATPRLSGLQQWWQRRTCAQCRRAYHADIRLTSGLSDMQAETLPETSLNAMLSALGLPALPGLSVEVRARMKAQLQRLLLLVGLVLFVTTLMQPELIGQKAVETLWFGGRIPNALQSAGLWLLLGAGVYSRPLIALLTQRAFRSRQTLFILLTAGLLIAACLWLTLALPVSRVLMLLALVGIGIGLALAGTVMGGVLVEQGQRMGATGRLGALHAASIFLARLTGAGLIGALGTQTLPSVVRLCVAGLAGFAGLCWMLRVKTSAQLAEEAPNNALVSGTQSSSGQSAGPREGRNAGNDAEKDAALLASGAWRDSWAQLASLLRVKTMRGAACIAVLLYIAPNFGALQHQENMRLGFSAWAQDGLDVVGGVCGLLGVAGYLVLCRRLSLQKLLNVGIVCNSIGTLLYLGYGSLPTAYLIEGANGLLSALLFAMLFDLAIRAVPRGQAMLGYALLTSLIALASHLSNVFGSWLAIGAGWNFAHVVSLSAFLGLPALAIVAYLPAPLLDRREGRIAEPAVSEVTARGVPSYSH